MLLLLSQYINPIVDRIFLKKPSGIEPNQLKWDGGRVYACECVYDRGFIILC